MKPVLIIAFIVLVTSFGGLIGQNASVSIAQHQAQQAAAIEAATR